MKLTLDRENTLVVGIDLQERLMPAMSDTEGLKQRSLKLIRGVKELGVPLLMTQQYTKGLGATDAEIAEAIGEFSHYEKRTFSAMKAEEFKEAVAASGKKVIVMFGIESHICLLQTSMDLMEAGYEVYVAEDCCCSRTERDHEMAMRRLMHAGATVTTHESVLYELLDTSTAPEFKAISNIVK